VEHGVSGFLSDDPDELRNHAKLLLEDRDLAVRMGREARKAVTERFALTKFEQQLTRSIEIARCKWAVKRLDLQAHGPPM